MPFVQDLDNPPYGPLSAMDLSTIHEYAMQTLYISGCFGWIEHAKRGLPLGNLVFRMAAWFEERDCIDVMQAFDELASIGLATKLTTTEMGDFSPEDNHYVLTRAGACYAQANMASLPFAVDELFQTDGPRAPQTTPQPSNPSNDPKDAKHEQ